jgi:hypothetical protein
MANFTTDSRTIKDLLASTVENTLNSTVVQDAIFDATPVVNRLRAGGQLKIEEGGERIRIPVNYAKNTTAKYYNDLDALDVTRSDTSTAAFYAWKQASASVVVSGREMRINKSTKSKLFDLVNHRMTVAGQSLVDLLATGVFSDGTGSGNKQVTGLEAAIETTPGSTAYASIPTANTAWRNQVATSVGAAAVNLVPNLRTVTNNCSQGAEGADSSPNLYVTTRSIHESYEALMFPQVRYEQNPGSGADAGINILKFKGQDFIWSDYCTSGTVYVLNLNHVYLYVHSDANFAKSSEGMQKPINQDSMVCQILFMGNVAVDNRRKQGKLAGVT